MKISDNVIVGALSLVNKDVPENSIVAGIPAKVIRIRNQKEIKEFQEWMRKNNL